MCRSSSKDGLDVQTSISMMDPVIEDVDLRAVEHGHGDELAPRSSPVGLALLRARATSPERNDLAGVPERKEIMFTREKISEVESGKCQNSNVKKQKFNHKTELEQEATQRITHTRARCTVQIRETNETLVRDRPYTG